MNLTSTALLLVDLQNDFLHKDGGYARGGATNPDTVALPEKLKPLCAAMRAKGCAIGATMFTLVPGRGGEPMISPHLQKLRPFLRKGDFMPGSWGQQVVDELAPVDFAVEKIAYSAFYMTRLEWVLRKFGIEHLIVGGIVTNGGVASTVRDAHVREFECTVLEDGCAAPTPAMHAAAIEGLRPVASVRSIEAVLADLAVS